jgi:regulator of replication initiation timing
MPSPEEMPHDPIVKPEVNEIHRQFQPESSAGNSEKSSQPALTAADNPAVEVAEMPDIITELLERHQESFTALTVMRARVKVFERRIKAAEANVFALKEQVNKLTLENLSLREKIMMSTANDTASTDHPRSNKPDKVVPDDLVEKPFRALTKAEHRALHNN